MRLLLTTTHIQHTKSHNICLLKCYNVEASILVRPYLLMMISTDITVWDNAMKKCSISEIYECYENVLLFQNCNTAVLRT